MKLRNPKVFLRMAKEAHLPFVDKTRTMTGRVSENIGFGHLLSPHKTDLLKIAGEFPCMANDKGSKFETVGVKREEASRKMPLISDTDWNRHYNGIVNVNDRETARKGLKPIVECRLSHIE